MSTARINLFWLVLFTLTLPVAVIVSTKLAGRSFEKVKLGQQTVRVKGYAEKPITSDRAEWSTRILQRNPDRTAAYVALEQNRTRVLAFLAEHGFPADQVNLGPVLIQQLYARDAKGNKTNTIESYALSQSVAIASPNVHAVSDIARAAGDLIAEGIELASSSPKFLYTQLDHLKLEMLAEATANARERGQLLVSNSGSALGSLRSASQGVFQITPAFSSETSSSGYNDTASLNKVIKAVVTVEYLIDS